MLWFIITLLLVLANKDIRLRNLRVSYIIDVSFLERFEGYLRILIISFIPIVNIIILFNTLAYREKIVLETIKDIKIKYKKRF